jgi:hypothetical protein
VSVRVVWRKIATCGSGSSSKVSGRIVRHLGWVQVPRTSMPLGSVSNFLGTRHPQLGSWISRMDASVVSSKEISASGWRFMFAEITRRLSCIFIGPWVPSW